MSIAEFNRKYIKIKHVFPSPKKKQKHCAGKKAISSTALCHFV